MPQPIVPDVLRARALDVLTHMEQFNATHPYKRDYERKYGTTDRTASRPIPKI